MRFSVLKLVVTFLLFAFFTPLKTEAQDLTGIWRGYFVSDQFDQYKLEIQIKQTPKKSVSGVTYSYLSTVFYGKATLTGSYNPVTKKILIQEIKTVELRMSGNSVACIMKYLLEYSRSGKEEFLEGNYTSKYEKSSTKENVKQGEGCGGGRVFLRKVPVSDFYVEPFLRTNPTVKKPGINQNPPVAQKPQARKPTAIPKPTTPKPEKPVSQAKPKADTIKRQAEPPVVKQEIEKPRPQPAFQLPSNTRSRRNELIQTINVKNKDIIVRLYDNGEVDDDTISVYMNSQLVLASKRLSTAPLTINLKLDEDNPEQVLIMVAENMGRIPPNTSLMIVYDGEKRYQVRITSTEQKNAMVRFRYGEISE